MKNYKFKLFQIILLMIVGFWTNQQLNAQCIPPSILSSSLCANAPIQFKMETPGSTNIQWNFNGTIINNEITPTFSFASPGTYQVTLTYTQPNGQPCTQTINITILPPPELDITIVTPVVQCYAGNKFTVIDNSKAAPGSSIKRVKYVAAGLQVEQNNPTMPFSFDFSTADPGGNFYSIDIEIEDANGCIIVRRLQDAVEVKPSLGLNFTSNRPRGCDSTLMTITNNSQIGLGAISKFKWDFGDGTFDSTNWGPQVNKMYYLEGPNNGDFNACLTVTDTTGCTETFCFTGSATNLIIGAEIVPNKDSSCISDPNIAFDLVPGLPTGATGFLWVFGDPDTGPLNIDDRSPVSTEHEFSKPGPFIVNYNFFHPICGNRVIHKQVVLLGPASTIPGPGIPIEQRYQCRSLDTVFFPNESKFFHNDRIFANDALGYFDTIKKMWIYDFDSLAQTVTDEDLYLDNRGKDCVFRIWDFDDDYAPRCTTDHNPIYPQRAIFNNLHLPADAVTGLWPKNTYDVNGNWINCKFSNDSLPKHMYTDWDDIYRDSFYLPNQPFQKTIVVKDDPNQADGCYRIQVDTTDLEEHRRQFFLQIPRCFNVKLYHEDTCHDFNCVSEAISQVVIMRPRASGMQKEGRYCFGGPPNFGITFNLDPGTRPGCSSTEAFINPDTALNPNNWIPFLPGGQTGTYQAPSPIMPYPMSGPYPNRLFQAYPNPGTVKDQLTGYANVGLIIGNGVGNNKCYDTAYYEKFIKFPVIDNDVRILIPAPVPGFTNLYKVCKGDSLVMQVTEINRTVPWDADQISYSFTRIAPSDVEEGGRFPFYSYVIFENYEWFVPQNNGQYLENFLNRRVIRTFGNNSQTLLNERFSIGTVQDWVAEADVSQIFDVLDRAFESLGFIMTELTPAEIADVISIGCIDTTGLGQFIQYNITPLQRTSTHYRDTTIFSLDPFGDPNDFRQNAYTFIAEENGIFNFNFTVRSRVGGCFTVKGHRVIVGFFNRLTVSDSIICKETEITGTPFFRYWHIDPDNNTFRPTWMDPTNYWFDRESEAGQSGKEGFTKWDWSIDDDDAANPNTIFGSNTSGTNPYGTFQYFSPVILGGNNANKIYYKDSGIYTLRLAASDSTGCPDTLRQNIYVTRLFANFGFKDTLNACVNIVTLFDSTKLIDPCPPKLGKKCDEIREWFIDWGDGKQPDIFNKQTYPPALGFNIGHNYTRAGTFNVKLRVKTDLGCEDSITKVFIIAGPIPEFITDKLEVCSGDSIEFFNLSDRVTNTSQWVWRFGDGKAKSEVAPNQLPSFKHEYVYNGFGDTLYEAYLTMFDSIAGRFCGFTYPDTTGGSQAKIEIRVIGKSPVTLTADKDTICPGDVVRFTVNGDPDYQTFTWNFNAENGNNDTLRSAVRIQDKQFNDIGRYMITTDGNMDPNILKCPDKDTIFVFVDSVFADFDIDSSKAPNFCFTNKSGNAVKSRWGFYHTDDITASGADFQDELESNEEKICRNYFDKLGTWYVCLVVENAGGCLDTVCKEVRFTRKIEIPNVFTPPSKGSGDNLNDVFDIPIVGHETYDLVIRNRWGEIVFKSKDSDYDWNGNVNNTGAACPDGEYIYMFRYQFKGTNEVIETNGIVVLIRQRD